MTFTQALRQDGALRSVFAQALAREVGIVEHIWRAPAQPAPHAPQRRAPVSAYGILVSV